MAPHLLYVLARASPGAPSCHVYTPQACWSRTRPTCCPPWEALRGPMSVGAARTLYPTLGAGMMPPTLLVCGSQYWGARCERLQRQTALAPGKCQAQYSPPGQLGRRHTDSTLDVGPLPARATSSASPQGPQPFFSGTEYKREYGVLSSTGDLATLATSLLTCLLIPVLQEARKLFRAIARPIRFLRLNIPVHTPPPPTCHGWGSGLDDAGAGRVRQVSSFHADH